jgi:hypothetical protein
MPTLARPIRDLEADLRFRHQQAQLEGAALRGERGLTAQLIAMSEVYKALKQGGRLDEAQAIKAEAYRLKAQAEAAHTTAPGSHDTPRHGR